MKYVFRLASRVKDKLASAGRAHTSKQSGVVRDAIADFLKKDKQSLADRPKLRGAEYKQCCVDVADEQIAAIKKLYSDVSVSVVIQAAVISELRKGRYRIADSKPNPNRRDEKTSSDANEHTDPSTEPDKSGRGRA